jgi:ESCRT-II complex subunit VPS22
LYFFVSPSVLTFLLASKGFWTEILGIGDFYYELAVQIVEICFSKREETGGLLEMAELLKKLRSIRGKSGKTEITEEDVERAIWTLEPLGSGYKIIKMTHRTFVQSVPREFSQDQSVLMKRAMDHGGFFNFALLSGEWNLERFDSAVQSLIGEGLVWVDSKTLSGIPDFYWIALFALV